MPLDLTGIQNVGEFYSHHYLDALLDNDLKGLFGLKSEVESAASAQHDLCFQPPLPKRSVLVSQHSAFQPFLIHPLS